MTGYPVRGGIFGTLWTNSKQRNTTAYRAHEDGIMLVEHASLAFLIAFALRMDMFFLSPSHVGVCYAILCGSASVRWWRQSLLFLHRVPWCDFPCGALQNTSRRGGLLTVAGMRVAEVSLVDIP